MILDLLVVVFLLLPLLALLLLLVVLVLVAALREREGEGHQLVIGTLSVPSIAVGIDARNGKVAIKGWVETVSLEALELARTVEDLGASTIIYTDISRDGMMSGVNVEATAVPRTTPFRPSGPYRTMFSAHDRTSEPTERPASHRMPPSAKNALRR